MKLPIEDDWKPKISSTDVGGDEYENHVKLLADRLREANKVAGQQSKLSHDSAKRYYDLQMKWEQFKMADFVYMRDPTYKRGKAKKFSYHYKGPFEIEQRISSLIDKVRLGVGTCAIVHVNRLKMTFERGEVSKIPVGENTPSSRTGGTDIETYRAQMDTMKGRGL
jgi:hypothetical protein